MSGWIQAAMQQNTITDLSRKKVSYFLDKIYTKSEPVLRITGLSNMHGMQAWAMRATVLLNTTLSALS